MAKEKPGLIKSIFIIFVAILVLLGLILLYPFFWLFCKITDRKKCLIRNSEGRLETPIVFYKHPETGKEVVFIGVLHIAELEYYATIQRFIDSLSDYKVLFEGVGKLSPEEEGGLNEKEKDIKRQLDHLFDLMQKAGDVMSLQHQKEGLDYKTTWINTDLKIYDLIRTFAEQNIQIINNDSISEKLFGDEQEQMLVRWLINKVFGNITAIGAIANIFCILSRNEKLLMKTIMDKRNDKAIKSISEHLAGGNVVTIWGAQHLEGIGKGLEQAGFEEAHREWFTAYHVRNYSFMECVKKMKPDTNQANT